MGLATHFGPWLLGTQKNTGIVSGTPVNRNIGATSVCQIVPVTYANTGYANSPSIVVPAGSLILGGYVETTVIFNGDGGSGLDNLLNISVKNANGSYINIIAGVDITSINKTSIFNGAPTATYTSLFLPNTLCLSPMSFIFYTSGTTSTAGSATVVFEYAVRNPDGSTI